ncbi:FAD-binding oxidoreductase [uncultured Roseobacter sp.]|uniref:NAD(P)/FAD-dependent oxidoreductase n=1 Tax=uncultured Roseobacter sp. TaxID=114847 RepID=UPI00261A16AA|nr:FAD-binding oxidoreductase [uncultured Roseobacter sp.]
MTRILVIGGGIAGLSVAARLSADAEVTVIEAEDSLGYHASGRSAALIEQNYGAPSVQALNRASVDYLRGHDGGYLTPRGLMIVANDKDKEAFDADVAAMGVHRISVADACAKVPVLDPGYVTLAAWHADAHDIDTDRLLQGFARTLRANGGRVVVSQRITAISHEDALWSLQSADDEWSTDILVNAAGAWADEVAGLAGIRPMGIVPYRRSMARVAAPAGHDVSGWPMFFGVSESWYAKPDAGALLVSPADEDPVDPHDAWAEDMTLAEGIALYEEVVTEPVSRMLSNWAGLRSFAPDRTLVLGPDPDIPSFVWCAGQGGYGMQTAPAASQLVADMVFGRPPRLAANSIAALRPERLR